MVRTVTIEELQQHTSELLDAAHCGAAIVVEDAGQPRGVVISMAEYERHERLRVEVAERARGALDSLRKRNAELDPDKVRRLVTDVVEEVRQEMYDAGRHGAPSER